MAKVAVVSLNLNFFGSIREELEKRHTVRLWKPTQDQARNFVELGGLCEWADIVWVEFCQHPVEWVLSLFSRKRVVVTLQRIEMYTPIYDLDWNAVDLLIFTCDHVKRRFYNFLERRNSERRTPSNLPRRDYVFQHPVYDGSLFKWSPRDFKPPYKVCSVGHIVPKKRQYTLVQMFADLPEEFHLNILGRHIHKTGYGNLEYLRNLEDLIEILGLEGRVHLLPWRGFGEMPGFYAGHDLLFHTSNEEARSRSIAEAMACGVYPLINHWRGAEELYPEKYIFNTPADFVEKALAWAEMSPEEKLRESRTLPSYLSTTQEEAEAYVEQMESIG